MWEWVGGEAPENGEDRGQKRGVRHDVADKAVMMMMITITMMILFVRDASELHATAFPHLAVSVTVAISIAVTVVITAAVDIARLLLHPSLEIPYVYVMVFTCCILL